MTEWYGEDLAYIHDVGHADFALRTAPGILEILHQSGVLEGLVVDLGCGSGLLARELVDAGYRVLGIDISEAMVEISRNRVPEAEFRVGSLFEADIPPCVAVTAVSEVLNYLFDPENERRGLTRLCRRVYDTFASGWRLRLRRVGAGAGAGGRHCEGFQGGGGLGGALREGGGRRARYFDAPDRQLQEGGGALQAGRRGPPRAVVRAGGVVRRATPGGLRGADNASLRRLPTGEGPRGIRRAQAVLR